MKMFVYWNFNRKCWSMRAEEGPHKGRVLYWVDSFTLHNCTFKVSEAGRQRVLRERRKNVHAGVVGDYRFEPAGDVDHKAGQVSYNPYESGFFYVAQQPRGDKVVVRTATKVQAIGRWIWALNGRAL